MKTNWKDDIFPENRKYRITDNSDGTKTITDATTYTQRGDSFGATELNAIGEEVNEIKKSVSDGKAEIAAAITLKRVATAATDTFAKMADNIKKIVLGSGNAQPADVLAGKTATNDSGVEFAGTMPRIASVDPAKSVVKSGAALYARMSYGAHVDNASSGYPEVSIPQASAASAAGINGDYMLDSANYLGVQGRIQSMGGVTITPQTYAQTVWSAWKRLTGNVEIAAVALPPANVIKKGYRYWIGGSYVDGTYVYSDITGYYYQAPNEMTGVTGGWVWYAPTDQKPDPGTLSRQPGYMEIKMNPGSWSGGSSSGSNDVFCFLCTAIKIDVTNIRTIRLPFIDGSYTNRGSSTYLGLSHEIPNRKGWSAWVTQKSEQPSPGNVIVLDVSNITGSYYLVIKAGAYYGSSSGTNTNTTRFAEIRYETMAPQ